MEIHRDGRSPETAFIVHHSSGEFTASMGTFIEKLFGGEDGSYFLLSETTLDRKETGKRYKVFYIEDCDNKKHTVFFEIG